MTIPGLVFARPSRGGAKLYALQIRVGACLLEERPVKSLESEVDGGLSLLSFDRNG